jgi:hypothetical protein
MVKRSPVIATLAIQRLGQVARSGFAFACVTGVRRIQRVARGQPPIVPEQA